MPAYFDGKLINSGKNEFTGKDGEKVVYFINTIAHDQGIITINSKRDFSEFLDVPATVTLTLRPDVQYPKLYKVSLTEISPQRVDRGHEKTIT
jgi:hypothetical protein